MTIRRNDYFKTMQLPGEYFDSFGRLRVSQPETFYGSINWNELVLQLAGGEVLRFLV